MDSALSVQEVTKRFGDFTAVDQVSFGVEDGKFFSILGPSGCGKTTLLRMIAGFYKPDGGTILFNGKNMDGVAPNKRPVNLVFQNLALFPMMNVHENIAFGLRRRGEKGPGVDKKVLDLLERVGLPESGKKQISQLSGGQKQRIAIARCLIMEPSVLLLDEPLGALDAKLREHMKVELKRLQSQVGTTFVYITHDQSEALSVSDRIAVMNKGKVLQIGTPYEIYEAPATRFVAQFIGESNSFPCTVLSCEPYEGEYLVRVDVPALKGEVSVTDYEPQAIGAKLDFTIRPEKVRISTNPPRSTVKELNTFKGIVDEPVYSGFQSKFYVKLEQEPSTQVKVFKQHTVFLEDGPDIEWKDTVYVSWTATDGYLVKDTDR